LLGQLFMSYHLEMPSEARNSKSKVFSELYDTIFDENCITAPELLRLYNLYLPLLEQKKEIQKKKRKKEKVNEKEAFISRATFHILTAIKYLFQQEISDIQSEKISASEKNNKIENLYKAKSAKYTERAINLIFEVVEKEMDMRGEIYTHDKFFKEIPTNNTIKQKVLSS
jgi:hypothetical protein